MHRAWAETYDEFAGASAIAAELGLRCYLGPSSSAGAQVSVVGRQVMADGHIVGVDEAGLAKAADRLMAKLMASHTARAPGRPRPAELFEPYYPWVEEG